VEFASGFQLDATLKWNPRPDVSSSPRQSRIRVGFQLNATLK